jgi:anaerobic nitric oxide reductase flavorubredoxin
VRREIAKEVYWVGSVDWSMRDFHSFTTLRGVTYNSYLILDEKIALIDTVKAPFAKELLFNLSGYTPTEKIDYLIVNHAEPDHASALPMMVQACKKAKVVCSKKCQEILSAYYDVSKWQFHIVKEGDLLSLGAKTLEFFETPMLHWPESMFTYLKEEKILFSMDAFGQHFSSSLRFDDEVDGCEVMEEAKKYYANILMPYGQQVLRALEKVQKLPLRFIAPSHGIVWRGSLEKIVALYREWASFKPKPKILVIYDTMWESTKEMALSIHRGASIEGVTAKLIFVRASNITDIVTEALDARAIAFGSANLNQGLMPYMGMLFTYLKGLKLQKKIGVAFGSFGWGKGAVEEIDDFLKIMGFEMISPSIKSQWKPTASILAECEELGKKLAEKIKQ